MPGQDERSVIGQHQRFGGDFHPLPLNAFDLGQHVPRVDHNTVTDHRELSTAHEAGRQQRQFEDLAVDHQRMTGIVPALETDNYVCPARQPVDNLALALVAPLGSYDHYASHVPLLFSPRRQGQDSEQKSKGPLAAPLFETVAEADTEIVQALIAAISQDLSVAEMLIHDLDAPGLVDVVMQAEGRAEQVA